MASLQPDTRQSRRAEGVRITSRYALSIRLRAHGSVRTYSRCQPRTPNPGAGAVPRTFRVVNGEVDECYTVPRRSSATIYSEALGNANHGERLAPFWMGIKP